MAKIKLEAAPQFKATVQIPVAGGDSAPVEFTFKHRTKDDVVSWLGSIGELKDADIILDLSSAWDLDDKFDAANIERLCQNYGGAGKAIFEKYLAELSGARSKN